MTFVVDVVSGVLVYSLWPTASVTEASSTEEPIPAHPLPWRWLCGTVICLSFGKRPPE